MSLQYFQWLYLNYLLCVDELPEQATVADAVIERQPQVPSLPMSEYHFSEAIEFVFIDKISHLGEH